MNNTNTFSTVNFHWGILFAIIMIAGGCLVLAFILRNSSKDNLFNDMRNKGKKAVPKEHSNIEEVRMSTPPQKIPEPSKPKKNPIDQISSAMLGQTGILLMFNYMLKAAIENDKADFDFYHENLIIRMEALQEKLTKYEPLPNNEPWSSLYKLILDTMHRGYSDFAGQKWLNEMNSDLRNIAKVDVEFYLNLKELYRYLPEL